MEVAINHLAELLNRKFTESKLLKERKPLPIYSIQKVDDDGIVNIETDRTKRCDLAIRFVDTED